MKKLIWTISTLMLLTACATASTTQVSPTETPLLPTVEAALVQPTLSQPEADVAQPESDDIFTQMDIALPAPACTGLTQSQMEGPYYTPNTPERNSLLEEGMTGTRLVLVGYVLDQNCQPLTNAKLDFWQTDSVGEYDNTGYRLRGHQFTDEQGRYYLETILPGLYNSRPIEHIHVKIQPEGGEEATSQLYFPNQPVDGLTIQMEDREDYLVGYFNFVVQK